MPNKKNTLMPYAIYEKQAELCSALAHPVRLQIIDVISNGEKTSTELLESIPIAKANMSQHLAVLKEAGIIKSRKDGVFHYVSLSIPKIKEACAMVRELLVEKLRVDEQENAEIRQTLKEKK